ncbi:MULTISPECIES: pseudouridine synthase [Bartonella]|uniref:pseudouridine synthase n=1 Tax=Bartonella TaxID=773 RepID=UPI0018DC2008|nr:MULTISPECIES: pseudouridine synthase [Bartonella]MBH9974521.1 rRNA pseudouridine synthase [Bartonella choladocola]MBI0014128.1 rRNA pseudouridine synthase [Bartonella sp. B10834G3]
MTYDRGNKKPQNDRGDTRNNFDPRGKKAPKQSREKTTEESDGSERIAKRLARAGIASRRDAETMIAAGRIAVNGKVLDTPAFNVKRTDAITVDGKPLPPIERTRVWLYHKRAGLVTTNRDPEGRPTVFDSLPEGMPRVLSVGRLDINTEGLLLLTNDGGLARVLELPSTGWVRKYRVRAHGKVTQADLDTLKDGIAIDGIFYGAVEATLEREQGTNVWLTVALREGKNREVKNILGALGLTVTRLIRISFGPFQLADLEEGAVRELKGRTLRDQLGERLIEEANADFDLPILKPFSNAPVVGEQKPREKPAVSDDGWISSTPEAPRFYKRWKKADFAERGRDQLSTRPDGFNKRNDKFGSKSAPFKKAFEKKPEAEPQRLRSSNVWMAPGARPQTAHKKFWRTRDEQERNDNGFEERAARRHPHRASQSESDTHFDRREKHFDKSARKPDFKQKFRKERSSEDYEGPTGYRNNSDYPKTGTYRRSENDSPDHGHNHEFAGEKKSFRHKSSPAAGRPPRKYLTERKFSKNQDFDRPERKFDRPERKYHSSSKSSEGGFGFPRRHYKSENSDGVEQRKSAHFSGNRSERPFSSKNDRGGKKAFAGKPAKTGKFLDRKGGTKGNGRTGSQRSGRPDGGASAGRRR